MSRYSVAEVSTRFSKALLLLRLIRRATLHLVANRKGSCNKARIRCKRCAVLATGLSGLTHTDGKIASSET